MPLLAERGRQDVAYRLATQRTYPSWGYMVEHGATTIWEHWNSNEIDKVSPGMNSFNHFCFGAVGQWFFEALAGINVDPAHPGFKKFVIRPRPVDGLDWVRCEYPSMYGQIRSAWRRQKDQFVLDVTVPPNTQAQVCVPTSGRREVTITEGGTPIVREGRVANSVPGVEFQKLEADAAVFTVGAGQYRFVAQAE